MQSQFIEKEITYDGTQLKSHWMYENFGLQGNSIVSFVGPCRVDLSHMVDLEDVLQKKPIFSEKMLHFIVEYFDHDLEKMILRQRLLICLMQEELMREVPDTVFVRKGNDLFVDHFKLSVSIATLSPVSTLIHTGINIISRNTPVPTQGLEDFGLNPVAFGWGLINRFIEEMKSVDWARCKVRGVF